MALRSRYLESDSAEGKANTVSRSIQVSMTRAFVLNHPEDWISTIVRTSADCCMMYLLVNEYLSNMADVLGLRTNMRYPCKDCEGRSNERS